jgi:hypothetical protein
LKLAEQLNRYGVTVDDELTPEAVPADLDALLDDDGVVNDKAFDAFLDELDEVEVAAKDHPVDRRAGLVFVARHKGEAAWYDEGDGLWVETR